MTGGCQGQADSLKQLEIYPSVRKTSIILPCDNNFVCVTNFQLMRNLKLLKSRLNLIVRVNVVLNRTVVVDSD